MENLEHWDKRAELGESSGSDDMIAKQLETRAIFKYIKDGMSVLEFGCGNGETAIEMAGKFDVKIRAFDYSVKMLIPAFELTDGADNICFKYEDIMDEHEFDEKFDLVYTQRCLINLPDWEAQKKAIKYLTSLLKPGGIYVMCENSLDGLYNINKLRGMLGLTGIHSPWHNLYFNDYALLNLEIPVVRLQHIDSFSSTYYFLSRVVNAGVSDNPDYNSPINKLALKLPATGNTAQGKIWVWRKDA